MAEALICDAIRTPIGRHGGTRTSIRADDLGAIPLKALMARNCQVDWAIVDDIFYGGANQTGEDNRNGARMAGLLAGLPIDAPGSPIHRLCGSGMDAIGLAARSIKAGDTHLMIAGGVESMSRAPFVMGKAKSAYSRNAVIFNTTIGWRFTNTLMKKLDATHSMPPTADNVAAGFKISRTDRRCFCSALAATLDRGPGGASWTKLCRSRLRARKASQSCSTPTTTGSPIPGGRCWPSWKT